MPGPVRTLSRRGLLTLLAGTALAACGSPTTAPVSATSAANAGSPGHGYRPLRDDLIARYAVDRPRAWGTDIAGVLTRLPTDEKVVALTFNACGGENDSGVDQKLLDFLRQRQIPATLFLNARWIDANQAVAEALAKDPLFELANHGRTHRPLSINGQSALGVQGTLSVAEVIDEVAGTHEKLTTLTGKAPRFFRSMGGYYDDVAVRLLGDLGEKAVSFEVNADERGVASSAQVERNLRAVKAGSIVMARMVNPGGGVLPGLTAALPKLTNAGFRFVRLSDVVKG
ncbi:Peptidoglycan/xylan/chitin deacetylase, PgdA/CDA1 family [Streptoalloteichus tenebrarius]|uniref:Peptidoglycan/xylan/chitin deacetylase, PgdA/CDA1 family n=1 Tax=Streptoalloteichus tenebrarius (strain ATCC 17920 / DSM 40477 / JCM 4838 / CBS 697.72 / NBRC 16177 / NCIMB 11028 / NRRL B-12390 / A12253. 1 / ISP 5477) TaxID=1933 RepID=A0ABT1HMK4_STRSD|nr:polysaccharide deacetylase family protein [Streptoalloteichus tenebrarius]MCP2256732.1 Peptidoglycan/xylan/chitin deacetylase, PgdA/CDA1 family [Streptoalloteichus tenebrarius]BFF00366.1 polysaccharide deacetylase family protein [Streptoalloteichus tenebrarius]